MEKSFLFLPAFMAFAGISAPLLTVRQRIQLSWSILHFSADSSEAKARNPHFIKLRNLFYFKRSQLFLTFRSIQIVVSMPAIPFHNDSCFPQHWQVIDSKNNESVLEVPIHDW